VTIEEDLQILDAKTKQLRLDYEQYFLGARPREPSQLRAEVQKLIALLSNVPIQNTGLRFKFSSLCSRFLIQRRQWDLVLRKIEDGTYERHVFKANLHARAQGEVSARSAATQATAPAPAPAEDLFDAYIAACRSVGQATEGLTRERLDRVMEQQRDALRARHGCDDVRFRVVVESGKAKLKATPASSRA
jgi:hypothetical protein